MAHSTVDYVVTRDGSMPVHFVMQKDALSYHASASGYSELKTELQTVVCNRPHRGYCGFCRPFAEYAGSPDYNEGTGRIIWDSTESFHLVAE